MKVSASVKTSPVKRTHPVLRCLRLVHHVVSEINTFCVYSIINPNKDGVVSAASAFCLCLNLPPLLPHIQCVVALNSWNEGEACLTLNNCVLVQYSLFVLLFLY